MTRDSWLRGEKQKPRYADSGVRLEFLPPPRDTRNRAYDRLMDAKQILERVASLKQEMRDLQMAKAQLDEPRSSKGSYESRVARLHEIKLELAEMLYEFKRTDKN
jgi:hypothetical protein